MKNVTRCLVTHIVDHRNCIRPYSHIRLNLMLHLCCMVTIKPVFLTKTDWLLLSHCMKLFCFRYELQFHCSQGGVIAYGMLYIHPTTTVKSISLLFDQLMPEPNVLLKPRAHAGRGFLGFCIPPNLVMDYRILKVYINFDLLYAYTTNGFQDLAGLW